MMAKKSPKLLSSSVLKAKKNLTFWFHVALNFNPVVLYVIIIFKTYFSSYFWALKQYSDISPVDNGTSIKQRLQRLLSVDSV